MTARLRALAGNGAVHVVFAFLAMGGWAVFANRLHPMPRPLVAGLAQGTISAALTLYLKSMVDALAARFSGLAGVVAPPLIACLTSTALLVAIHAASGTPEILRTIAVPLVVSTAYAAAYSYSIFRNAERQT